MGGDAEQCGAMASQDDDGSWKAGSIAERRAARCGFSLTLRLNTVRFRGVSPVSSPAARSPYLLTIPPGLSPAALLDSPVLLSNSQSQASPSIGKIRWLHVDQEIAASDDVAPPFSCLQSDESQSLVHSSILSDNLISADGKNEFMDIVNQEIEFGGQVCPPFDGVTVEPPLLNGDQTELCPSAGKRADEYNWRKYGQKHVKGSEYPRSYYKCTYPSCPVKKKVERSHDGQVTGIIYRGTHNHPIPQPARRSAFGMPCEISDATMGPGSSTNKDEEPILSSKQGSEYKNGAEWSIDGPSSSSIVTELSESLSTAQEKHPDLLKLTGKQEIPSTLTQLIDEEDVATQGTRSIEDDSEDPEIESKRMKKGTFLIETSSTSHSVREQKVVVQAISEVDILDDGYRWRKYGQKVVKGNPNPRSYYKCTNPGCSVKKHVERASHDLKSVITTYAGKHNHGVPVARNNNEISSCFNMQPASNAQTPGTLPGYSNLSISDLRVFQHIENKPEFGSDFKPGYTESVIVNPLAGTSLCYDVKPSHLQRMHFASFGLEINPIESYHANSIANVDREYHVSIPAELYRPNISLSSNDLNQGRFNFSESQPFLPHQQPTEGNIRNKQPHGEVKNEIYTIVSAPSDSPAFTDGQYFGGSPM